LYISEPYRLHIVPHALCGHLNRKSSTARAMWPTLPVNARSHFVVAPGAGPGYTYTPVDRSSSSFLKPLAALNVQRPDVLRRALELTVYFKTPNLPQLSFCPFTLKKCS
jgi:hypothetical protein